MGTVGSGPHNCEISTSNGFIIARRVRNVESGDEFVLDRGPLPTPGDFKKLSVTTTLSDSEDADDFYFDLFLDNAKDATISVDCGGDVFSYETQLEAADLHEVEVSTEAAMLSLLRNPEGRCVHRSAVVVAAGEFGSQGQNLSSFYGIVFRHGQIEGHLKGVSGYSLTRQQGLDAFKAIKPDGSLLFNGRTDTPLNRWISGSIWDQSGDVGQFKGRCEFDRDATVVPYNVHVYLRFSSECDQ